MHHLGLVGLGYDGRYCDVCERSFRSYIWLTHLDSQNHKKKSKPLYFICPYCRKTVLERDREDHQKEFSHLIAKKTPISKVCYLCDQVINLSNRDNWTKHINSNDHIRKENAIHNAHSKDPLIEEDTNLDQQIINSPKENQSYSLSKNGNNFHLTLTSETPTSVPPNVPASEQSQRTTTGSIVGKNSPNSQIIKDQFKYPSDRQTHPSTTYKNGAQPQQTNRLSDERKPPRKNYQSNFNRHAPQDRRQHSFPVNGERGGKRTYDEKFGNSQRGTKEAKNASSQTGGSDNLLSPTSETAIQNYTTENNSDDLNLKITCFYDKGKPSSINRLPPVGPETRYPASNNPRNQAINSDNASIGRYTEEKMNYSYNNNPFINYKPDINNNNLPFNDTNLNGLLNDPNLLRDNSMLLAVLLFMKLAGNPLPTNVLTTNPTHHATTYPSFPTTNYYNIHNQSNNNGGSLPATITPELISSLLSLVNGKPQ